MQKLDADVVIVGAGTAGCVLAARLSEDPGVRVALIEAGGPDTSPWIHVPSGIARMIGNPKFDWCLVTDPVPGFKGRAMPFPRGRMLGGTGSLNGMIYIRGHPRDYDSWREAGNAGWGWEDVLPYFKRSEANVRGADALHGGSGPLAVSEIGRGKLADAFLGACAEAGFPSVDDFNGPAQEGAGYYQMMTRRGRRSCGTSAYLRPARRRSNLQVLASTHTTRILFSGRRAIGVEFRRGAQAGTIQARREVILAAGTFHSPQLLQLSGIGPADLLQHCGIAPVLDLPGVGANLQDHLQTRLLCRCTEPITINDVLNSPLRLAGEVLRYAFARTGILAWGPWRTGLFACSSASPGWPDIQVHFGPVGFTAITEPPTPYPSFTLSACLLRPQSRGRVHVRSNDPMMPPAIQPDYLSAEADCRLMIEAFKLGRRILRQSSIAPYVADEKMPGASCVSDAQILDYVRETAGTVHHPVGTCRMGSDRDAVVDARFRVHGLEGLRVVDGSVMPSIVSGNTNAPIVMMAERGGDFIKDALS